MKGEWGKLSFIRRVAVAESTMSNWIIAAAEFTTGPRRRQADE